MKTYFIRFNNGPIDRSIRANNIDNLRKKLIQEFNGKPKINVIGVEVLREKVGTVRIGKLILGNEPIWVSFAMNSNTLARTVSPRTGKLGRE